jgi:hypothetical protein
VPSRRTVKRTKYPGIYTVSVPGRPPRFMVSNRLRALGSRTRTFSKLTEATRHQGNVRDPVGRQQLTRLARGRTILADYSPLFLEKRRRISLSTRAWYESVRKLYIVRGPQGSKRHDQYLTVWCAASSLQAARRPSGGS